MLVKPALDRITLLGKNIKKLFFRFYKGDEPDSDIKEKIRTHVGEWKTSDKEGQYGERNEG